MAAGTFLLQRRKGEWVRYTYLNHTFCGPGALDPGKTIDELVTLIARQTTLTEDEIEARLLDAINEMVEGYEPKEGK